MRTLIVLALTVGVLTILGCNGGSDSLSVPGLTSPESTVCTVTPVLPGTAKLNDITLTVPSATFSQETKVTLIAGIPTELPPSSGFVTIGSKPGLEIDAPSTPIGSVTITIQPESDGRAIVPDKFVYFLTKKVGTSWTAVSNPVTAAATDTINFVVDKSNFVWDGVKASAQMVIGKVLITAPIETMALEEKGNDPTVSSKRVIVGVHGVDETTSCFDGTFAFVKTQHRYSRFVALSYDWRLEGVTVARKLGEYLDQLYSDGWRIDVIAHSKGVDNSRWNLEKLGKTKGVENFYAVCGANQGSYLSNFAAILRALQIDYLNQPGSASQPIGIAGFDTPAVAELVPNSAFISSLNSSTPNAQRGHYNIVTWGGGLDMVVGMSSGLAENVPLEALTRGWVNRIPVATATHSSLLESRNGPLTLWAGINPVSSDSVQIWTEPAVCNGLSDDRGWKFVLKIKNNGAEVSLTDLVLDSYSRDGRWTVSCWLITNLPSGQLLPTTYQSFNLDMGNGETYAQNLIHYTDSSENILSQTPLNMQAQTMELIMRGKDVSGVPFEHRYLLTFRYGDIWPSEPQIRSMPIDRGNGQLSGGLVRAF